MGQKITASERVPAGTMCLSRVSRAHRVTPQTVLSIRYRANMMRVATTTVVTKEMIQLQARGYRANVTLISNAMYVMNHATYRHLTVTALTLGAIPKMTPV